MKQAIADWLDKFFVPEWRKAWQMLSFWWNAICAAAGPVWVTLSDDQKASILGVVGIHPSLYISAAFIIGIVLRLKAQGIAAPKVDP
ncbi:hypothetical protein [Variovorax sp. N23]|uniref:DUF7940 domain-containing protein n=1 Tax=Variovorax sp. N23 TaxID=2980555 RepID=UPI0021C68907|nr:hypothetical protein [Variovorax sp. N23]MCU4119283.1 hypothetical protein [Variovorax sp. N23]